MDEKQELTCTSCKKVLTNLSGNARFACPNCSKAEIVRCGHCRKLAAKYKCSSCNFEGPN